MYWVISAKLPSVSVDSNELNVMKLDALKFEEEIQYKYWVENKVSKNF